MIGLHNVGAMWNGALCRPGVRKVIESYRAEQFEYQMRETKSLDLPHDHVNNDDFDRIVHEMYHRHMIETSYAWQKTYNLYAGQAKMMTMTQKAKSTPLYYKITKKIFD